MAESERMDRRTFIKSTMVFGAVTDTLLNPALAQTSSTDLSAYDLVSNEFALKVNGEAIYVGHAAAHYSFANFLLSGSTVIEIEASIADFWAKGVEIRPSHLGVYPEVFGRTIRFTIDRPQKLVISRPGDHAADAIQFFLFANLPELKSPPQNAQGLKYYGPGIYNEHIHVKSNETIHLAEGAFIFGSINFEDVENASVEGRGVIIHHGPQNPDTDEGWQTRPDWHAIYSSNSRGIRIEGITCLVRSRTWMVQLVNTDGIRLDNIKVIGGTKGNANQDGIDFLGCSNAVVNDCFFRCSDDIFAIYGNTGFYDNNVSIPGRNVENILIERCVLSTSISNVVRVGWPKKVFNSKNFTMRNCDVVSMGMGSCVVPFALAEFWSDPDGIGTHSDYLFDDIRLDSLYALAQLRQPSNGKASVTNIRFRKIRTYRLPPLSSTVIAGDVRGVSFEQLTFADRHIESERDIEIDFGQEATPATWIPTQAPQGRFDYTRGSIEPHCSVRFDARETTSRAKIVSFHWNFGDGHTAEGAVVEHAFKDESGSLHDDSGSYSVQLKVVDATGQSDTIVRPVVIGDKSMPAKAIAAKPGIAFKIFKETSAEFLALDSITPERSGIVKTYEDLGLANSENFTLILEGFIRIPQDGGYTFTLVGRDGVALVIDGKPICSNEQRIPQACDTVGNVIQFARGQAILRAGLHRFRLDFRQALGSNTFGFFLQGPGICLQSVPWDIFEH